MNNKKIKMTSSLKYGAYSLISVCLLLAIIIIFNLAISALPPKYTKITDNKSGIYNISDTSKNLLSSLKDEITVYLIAKDGQSNDYHLKIENYLKRYVDLSKKLTLKTVDPLLRPSFISHYTDAELDSSLTHLIVVNDRTDRSFVCEYSTLISSEIDESLSYEEQLQYYMAYGTYKYVSKFNVENALLSAVTYVTMEKTPNIYFTTGHGESNDDSYLSYVFEVSHVETDALDLSLGDIPSDAEAILINAPTKDFTDKEIEKLKKFSDRGGNIALISGFTSTESDSMPLLHKFISEYYGLKYNSALVLEGNTEYAYKYGANYVNYVFYPQKLGAIKDASSSNIYYQNAHLIDIPEKLPEGVKAEKLLTTSAKGYLKTVMTKETSTLKGENDPEGIFTVGAQSIKKIGESDSTLLWFSSASALALDSLIDGGYDNAVIAIHIMSKCTTDFNPVSVKDVVSLEIQLLNVDENANKLWSIIFIGIIPVSFVGLGLINRYRRAKR